MDCPTSNHKAMTTLQYFSVVEQYRTLLYSAVPVRPTDVRWAQIHHEPAELALENTAHGMRSKIQCRIDLKYDTPGHGSELKYLDRAV